VKWASFIPVEEDLIMMPNPLLYQLLVVVLILICLLIHTGLLDKPLPSPSRPSNPTSADAHAPKNPSPFLDCSTNRGTRPVHGEPRAMPRRPARHLPPPASPEVADGLSIRTLTSIQTPIALTTVGWAVATSAPMGVPAVSPGASCSVSPARAI